MIVYPKMKNETCPPNSINQKYADIDLLNKIFTQSNRNI